MAEPGAAPAPQVRQQGRGLAPGAGVWQQRGELRPRARGLGTRCPSGPAARGAPGAVSIQLGESAATPSRELGMASLLQHQDRTKLSHPALPGLME